MPTIFYWGLHEVILKFIWKNKCPQTIKTILKKTAKGRIFLTDIKMYSYGKKYTIVQEYKVSQNRQLSKRSLLTWEFNI